MASRSAPFEDFFFTATTTTTTESNDHKNFLSSDEKSAWPWLEPTTSSKPREYLYMERTERRALHTELPNDTGGTLSIPNYLASEDCPIYFSDPVEGGSVHTGMSQQELLRKKARESIQQSRKSNKKKRSKKPVVQITGFLSSRTPSLRNSYPNSSSKLSSNLPRKLTDEKPQSSNSLSADAVAARWKRMEAARSDDIELSTAETTLTDSSSRHRTKNPPSPLRVVLNDGDLMLTAKQSKLHAEFATLGDDEFPLLSRSASESFQTDSFFDHSETEPFSNRAYGLDNPPIIAREQHAFDPEARQSSLSSYDSPYNGLSDPSYGRLHLSGHESKVSSVSALSERSQSTHRTSSVERRFHSERREEPVGKKNHNRSVRFSADIIMPASLGSQGGSREEQRGGMKPKSILREPRYQVKSPGVLTSSSPLRFSIRKPQTPEKSDLFAVKSVRSIPSPSSVAGVLEENGPIFSPILKGAGDSPVQPYERYPDPPLDSVNIDDDDTTYASRNDVFLETIAAIVIQAAIRRFLATRYLEMVKEHIAIEMNVNYINMHGKEQQMNLSGDAENSPLRESLNNRSSQEKSMADTSPHRPSISSDHTDRHREVEDNLQRKMVDDMFNLAAIQIQAAFRGFWARDSLNVDHFCATLIQRCVRRYLCEKKYRYGYYHVFRYAVRIQSLFRGTLARQNLHRSIGAAILIQAYVRGFIGRKRGDEKKTNIQRRIKSMPVKNGSGSRQQIDNNAAQKLFPSRRPEAFNKEKSTGGYHRASNSRQVTHSGRSTIQDLAAIKIQTRYRTHACERKLIRSLVDILIAQTVIRRWLAIKRAGRLRTLRDRCQTILEDGKTERCKFNIGNENLPRSRTAPRLVSRSEFFQNQTVYPQRLGVQPHYDSISESGPSFDEDEFRQLKKNLRTTYLERSNSGDEPGQIRTNGFDAVAGSTSSSLRRMKAQDVRSGDNHASSQLLQRTSMTLRPTRTNFTEQQTVHNGLGNRTPRQLISSGTGPRVISTSSYDSEAKSSTPATHSGSERRQVVVTPPVLLKRNTDRKVARS